MSRLGGAHAFLLYLYIVNCIDGTFSIMVILDEGGD